MEINPNHLLGALQRQRDEHANDAARGWAENMALKDEIKVKDEKIAELESKLAALQPPAEPAA